MTTSGSSDNCTYHRCRFTLSNEVREMLEKLAEEQYGGNKSALVRAAIREKVARPDLNQIRIELKLIRELIEEESRDENEETDFESDFNQNQFSRQSGPLPNNNGNNSSNENNPKTPTKTARELFTYLSDTKERSVRFTELLDAVDASYPEVAVGAEELVARNQLEQTRCDGELAFRRLESGGSLE